MNATLELPEQDVETAVLAVPPVAQDPVRPHPQAPAQEAVVSKPPELPTAAGPSTPGVPESIVPDATAPASQPGDKDAKAEKPKTRRPRGPTRGPRFTPIEHPMRTAAREGRVRDVITLLADITHLPSTPWKLFRECAQAALKNDRGQFAADVVDTLLTFQFEIFARCQLAVSTEMKLMDESTGPLNTHQIGRILETWGPRLSRLQTEVKDLLAAQAKLRHIHSIADREAVRLKSVSAQLDPLMPGIFPSADPSMQYEMRDGQPEPGDGQPST